MSIKHGDEGTHWACQEALDEHGGKTKCCECSGHECRPPEFEPELE